MTVYLAVGERLFSNRAMVQVLEDRVGAVRMTAQTSAPESSRRFNTKATRALSELRHLAILLMQWRRYRDGDIVVTFVRHRHLAFLVFSRLKRLFGKRVGVYLYGFYAQSWTLHPASRLLLRYLITEDVALMAQCRTERDYLMKLSGAARVGCYPYCRVPISEEAVPRASVCLGDYVFSGGHSDRDYATLIEAARRLDGIRFRIVCSKRTQLPNEIPGNVSIERDLPPHEFYTLLAGSRAVVIPLVKDVGSSGQSVALAAMQFGKAVFYTNVDSVAQYFKHEVDGVAWKQRDPQSLTDALSRHYLDAARLREIGGRARDRFYSEFTRRAFEDEVLRHIEGFVAEFGQRAHLRGRCVS